MVSKAEFGQVAPARRVVAQAKAEPHELGSKEGVVRLARSIGIAPDQAELLPYVVDVHAATLRKQHDCQGLNQWVEERGGVYVGRMNRFMAKHLDVSVLCKVKASSTLYQNPFPIARSESPEAGRARVLDAFEKHMDATGLIAKHAMKPVSEGGLLGADCIGCWCHPQNCHAHAILLGMISHMSSGQLDKVPSATTTHAPCDAVRSKVAAAAAAAAADPEEARGSGQDRQENEHGRVAEKPCHGETQAPLIRQPRRRRRQKRRRVRERD